MRDEDPQSGPSNTTRRAFLLTTGSTAAATVIAACVPTHADSIVGQSGSVAGVADGPNIEGAVPITLRINGKDHQLRIDPRTTLLDCLRETVALTGTKKGCDHGQCGACTVHVKGRRVNSCLSLAVMHDGEDVGVSRRESADCHPSRNACTDTEAMDRCYGVVEDLDIPD